MSRGQLSEKAIFDVARRIEAEEVRASYLEQACGDDPALQERVIALLRIHDEQRSFLEFPPAATEATLSPATVEGPGSQIGPYKIREQIGEGGFGAVYVAQQQKPVSRKVALKVIKPGMDSKNVIARFEAERQALAMMDHPNIATVLDAGTAETGRPYFVMELVYGVPLTEFADEHKLPTRQRLDLFLDVCHAVQHAHHKGIIHRDLKPSNILVTLHDDKPVPKVIDFGVAKALSHKLTENTVYTAYGQMVGTPLYMSPEQTQLTGLDVDTRSDVYSLGVLLYELITGTTPFDKKILKTADFEEVRRIIREDEPPRPSVRVSTLDAEALSTVSSKRKVGPRKLGEVCRGELDWIVMKALEKDRTRRYETVTHFATDIRRYLNNEPVEACPPSTIYRLKKLVRRNKVPLAAAALIAVALICGLIGTALQASVAKAERDDAEVARQRAVDAERVANDRRRIAEAAKNDALESRRLAEAKSEEVTRLLVSSHVDHAQALCEQGEIGRGLLWLAHGLRTAPPDAVDLQRAIRLNLGAWHGQLHSLQTVVQHPSEVAIVAFSPDGSRIVTACADGFFRLWNAATGHSVAKSTIRYEAWSRLREWAFVDCLAFSPDGSRIVSGSNEGTAQLWDAATLKPIGEPLQHAPLGEAVLGKDRVRIVGFSQDGTRIVTGSGYREQGAIRVWNAATQQAVGKPLQQNPVACRACPDGLLVLSRVRGDTQVELWNVDKGELVGPPIETGPVSAAAISPDGTIIATASRDGGQIKLWRTETAETATEPVVHGGVVLSLAFSADGSHLLSGGNTRASMLWDTATGQPIGTSLRQLTTARTVALSEDRRRLAAGSEDGSVRIWNVAREQSTGWALQHKDPVVAAGYRRDRLHILTENQGAFEIRDAHTGEPAGKAFPRHGQLGIFGSRLVFSPDGSKVFVNGNLRDVATGEAIGNPLPGLRLVAFSPDGSRMLAGDAERQTYFGQLWDALTTQRIGKPLSHSRAVLPVAFSPDGSRLLTGCFDGTIQLWHAATMDPIGEAIVNQSEVKALAYSPDGNRVVIGFADGTVRLWDLATRRPIGVPLHHQNIVSGVAFSPDGERFLTCSLDGTARLWDTPTQKPIGPALRHNAWWPTLSFSPDGKEFLVVGQGGTAEVWESPQGPLEGDIARIDRWVEVITGLTMDEGNGIGAIDAAQWQQRNRDLQQRGGPPMTTALPAPASTIETDFSRSMSLALHGYRRAERGQWDQAAGEFGEAIKLNGNSPTLRNQIACWWNKLAQAQFELGHHEEFERLSRHAVALLRELTRDFPKDPNSWETLDRQYVQLVDIFANTGRLEDELEARRQRITVHQELANLLPSEWSYHLDLGNLQLSLGRQLKRLGRSAEANECFANAVRQLQKPIDEAQDQAELLTNVDRRRLLSHCHHTLGETLDAAGRSQEAIAPFRRALELNPAAWWVDSSLAYILLRLPSPELHDLEQALKHATKGVEGAPTPPRLRILGRAHQALGLFYANSQAPNHRDLAKAVQHAQKAIETQPDNVNFVSFLGRVHYLTADYAAAIDPLERSIPGLNAVNANGNRLYLVIAHWRLGHEHEALRWYKQAVGLMENSTVKWVHKLRAEAGKLLGVTEEGEPNAPPASPPN